MCAAAGQVETELREERARAEEEQRKARELIEQKKLELQRIEEERRREVGPQSFFVPCLADGGIWGLR